MKYKKSGENVEENENKIGFSSKKKTVLISAIAGVILIGGAGAAIGIISSNQPQSSQSILSAGEKYLLDQKYEQAIIEFQRVIEIDPMNASAYLGLADAYIGLGNTEKALEVLREGYEKTGDASLQAKIDELTKSVSGSMGSVTVAGTEIDIATTEELFIINKDFYDENKGAYGYAFHSAFALYINENLSNDDLNQLSRLSNLKRLEIDFAGISDLSFLEKLTNLTDLWMNKNQISDITPLAGLKNLTWLSLDDNQISDITPLAGLTNLTSLNLDDNQISDITPLAGLKNLTHLTLQINQISDITPLGGLMNLTGLYLYVNQISDITPLAGLTNLTYLRLDENQISDITPLAGLKNLELLFLEDNQISDITPLGGLTNLTELLLYHNQISDITPLAGLTNLTQLMLNENQISDADIEWLKEQLPNCDVFA